MILEVLGQLLQVFTGKTGGSRGMNQTSMLQEPLGRIHYNVKTGLSDL
jgi:hypothetical protein